MKLLAVASGLLIFLSLLHHLLQEVPAYRKYDKRIQEKNIDPTALFYSEEPHTYSAGKWVESRIGGGEAAE